MSVLSYGSEAPVWKILVPEVETARSVVVEAMKEVLSRKAIRQHGSDFRCLETRLVSEKVQKNFQMNSFHDEVNGLECNG
jgi:hypothetical protein